MALGRGGRKVRLPLISPFEAVPLCRGGCQTTLLTFLACPFESHFWLRGSNQQSRSQVSARWVPVSLGSLRSSACPGLRERGYRVGRRGESFDCIHLFWLCKGLEQSRAVSEGSVNVKAHWTEQQSSLSNNGAFLNNPHPFIYFLLQWFFFSLLFTLVYFSSGSNAFI